MCQDGVLDDVMYASTRCKASMARVSPREKRKHECLTLSFHGRQKLYKEIQKLIGEIPGTQQCARQHTSIKRGSFCVSTATIAPTRRHTARSDPEKHCVAVIYSVLMQWTRSERSTCVSVPCVHMCANTCHCVFVIDVCE